MAFREGGFTLTELLVALGISSFLVLAALSQNLSVFQNRDYLQKRTSLNQSVAVISDYLRNQVLALGGRNIAGFMGAWVENNCKARGNFPDCKGSDRLTITTADTTGYEFPLVAPSGGGTLNIDPTAQIGQLGGGSFSCQTMGVAAYNPPRPFFISSGDNFESVLVSQINNCVFKYTTNTQASGGDNPIASDDWSGGVVSPVTVTTFYMDPAAYTLNQYVTGVVVNGISASSPFLTNTVLALNVFDFQVALGVDLNNDNNLVDDGTATDNWLYNAPGEAWGAGVFGSANLNQIKMIEVAVALGNTNISPNQNVKSAQLLDGPVRTPQNVTINSVTYPQVDLLGVTFKVVPRVNISY